MIADNDILVQFGMRIRQLRRERKLSQEDLGLEAGLEQVYISDIERGTRNISLRNIHALARALDLTLEELFRGMDTSRAVAEGHDLSIP